MRGTVVASCALLLASAGVASAVGDRVYSAGHFMLELDGVEAGFLKGVAGGGVRADVIEYHQGSKRVGTPVFEEIGIRTGLGMSVELYDWIDDFLDRTPRARDGAIVGLDVDFKARRRLAFTEAEIVEVGFPALDALSPVEATLEVVLKPKTSQVEPGDGKAVNPPSSQKVWLASNFRLQVGDLPCSRVVKVDAFSVAARAADEEVGRLPGKKTLDLDVPSLRVTLSAVDAQPWLQWFESFVIDGENGDDDELAGTIEFLSPDLKTILGRLELRNVGIHGIDLFTPAGDANAPARFVVDLYVEDLDLLVTLPAPPAPVITTTTTGKK